MNKKNTVIVVEGTSDINKLKNLVKCEIVGTNGSAISRETIDYLKSLADTHRIIILTDPDYPGEQIRKRINKEIPDALHAFVDRKKAVKGKKLGVAETDIDEIKRALGELVCFKETVRLINTSDLMSLGLIGGNSSTCLRNQVAEYFHLGHCNAKTFEKRLNGREITLSELKETIAKFKKEGTR